MCHVNFPPPQVSYSELAEKLQEYTSSFAVKPQIADPTAPTAPTAPVRKRLQYKSIEISAVRPDCVGLYDCLTEGFEYNSTVIEFFRALNASATDSQQRVDEFGECGEFHTLVRF